MVVRDEAPRRAQSAPEPRVVNEPYAAMVQTAVRPSDADAARSRCSVAMLSPRKVSGVIVPLCAYGPPNFGADPGADAKEQVYFLLLDEPIAELSPNGPLDACYSHVTMLQLSPATDSVQRRPRELVGQHVSLSVTEFFAAETGHHYSRVLLQYDRVLSARPAPKRALRAEWPRVAHDFIGAACGL